MRYPKDVLVWEYAPGRKLVQVTITLRNVRGALSECSAVIAKYKVNVLSGFTSTQSSSSVARWSFFADVTDSTVPFEEFQEKLTKLSCVEEVVITPSQDGFLFDAHNFPVKWSGRRIVLLRTEALSEMISRLWDVFGTGAAGILDQMAQSMGRFAANEIIDDFGKEFATKNLASIISAYTALGYAEVQVKDYNREQGSVVLTAKHLFECEGNARLGIESGSVFFKGHLRGFMGAVFDSDFSVQELQCVGSGGKVCSFEIRRIEKAEARVPSKLDQAHLGSRGPPASTAR